MPQDAAPLAGRRILVVEDDYVIASSLAELLEQLGAEVVGPAPDVEEGLKLVEHENLTLSFAVLDVDLQGQKSFPIADALIRRGVPFMFATGYSSGSVGPDYARYPRRIKPVSEAVLLAEFEKVAGL